MNNKIEDIKVRLLENKKALSKAKKSSRLHDSEAQVIEGMLNPKVARILGLFTLSGWPQRPAEERCKFLESLRNCPDLSKSQKQIATNCLMAIVAGSNDVERLKQVLQEGNT